MSRATVLGVIYGAERALVLHQIESYKDFPLSYKWRSLQEEILQHIVNDRIGEVSSNLSIHTIRFEGNDLHVPGVEFLPYLSFSSKTTDGFQHSLYHAPWPSSLAGSHPHHAQSCPQDIASARARKKLILPTSHPSPLVHLSVQTQYVHVLQYGHELPRPRHGAHASQVCWHSRGQTCLLRPQCSRIGLSKEALWT